MKFSNPMVHGMKEMVATREEVPRNPWVDDKDDAVNLGNVAGIMRADGIDHANVKKVDFGVVCFSLSILPTLKENVESHTGFKEGFVLSNLEAVQAEYRVDGLLDNSFSDVDKLSDKPRPSSFRPKTTWTRINRMDFRLGGLAKAITLPSLGKRDTRATSSGHNEEHETKRGRVEGNVVDILAGMDNHPCWKQ